MGAGLWVWVVPESAQLIAGIAFFVVLGLGLAAAFAKRVAYIRKTTDVMDLRGM